MVECRLRGLEMNWLEFWSTIARSLVWPIVVIILAYWFRDSIKAAIPRLSKVKGGGFEAEFERKLEEVEIEVAKDKLFETVEPFSEFQREKYRQLIEVTPALGVTEAWTDVDFALRPLLGSKVSTSQIIDQKVLEESGL